MINAREGGQRRDFMRIGGLIVGTALLDACAPGISKLSPTDTLVAPTGIPSEVPTLTPEVPAVEAIPKDQMEEIVAKLNTDLQGGYALSPNPDGTYVVKGPDGTAVNNIRLNVDGNVNLTLPDGTVENLPPETVFMPTADTIYAALYQVNVKSGSVGEIPFEDTKWPTDPEHQSPRITSEMLPQYNQWIRDQLEKTGQLTTEFLGANKDLKWKLGDSDDRVPFDVTGDGIPDRIKTRILLPDLLPKANIFTVKWTEVPIRSFPSFVRLIDKDNISVLPQFIKNSDSGKGEYSLFSSLIDTDRINLTKSTLLDISSLLNPDTVFGDAQGKLIKPVAMVSVYLYSEATIQATGDTSVIPLLRQGTDPTSESARLAIVDKGINEGSFSGSEFQLWGTDLIVVTYQ